MTNEEKRRTAKTPNYERMNSLSKKYASFLIRSGYPTNTHVYDINQTYLDTKLPCPEALFLTRLKKIFASLHLLERLIFVNDFLERDKNYQFWWLDYGNEDFINKERRKLECKLKKHLKYLLAIE